MSAENKYEETSENQSCPKCKVKEWDLVPTNDPVERTFYLDCKRCGYRQSGYVKRNFFG